MRTIFFCMALCVTGAALADIPPPPEARNRPYLEALRNFGHPCASIAERRFLEHPQEPDLARVKAEIQEVICADGPRYRMTVEQLPRVGRSHINAIRALRIERTR